MASEEHLARKLTAILYADVAGYSRLTGEDEEGTHRHLSEYLDLISTAVETHQGRVVHYAGDAVLADFTTVTEALNCAWEIQQTLALRNDELPAERRVEFRIGVNLGEVIVDRDDIYGDGVNVAARLESLAEPGGICVSESVRTAAGSKLALGFEFLGKQKEKNITEPISVYRVRLQPGSRAYRALPNWLMRHKVLVKFAAGTVLLGFAVFLFIQFRDSVDLPGTSPDYTAMPKVGTELSLAVLPSCRSTT